MFRRVSATALHSPASRRRPWPGACWSRRRGPWASPPVRGSFEKACEAAAMSKPKLLRRRLQTEMEHPRSNPMH
ncbi:hypothetical protein M885DRAFT_548134 [Pelagophyceae sp. CCMP2097]|nr:hypothetical protein M885DRAFT_548134 [Pelagophyceae sp. CCMP2097]